MHKAKSRSKYRLLEFRDPELSYRRGFQQGAANYHAAMMMGASPARLHDWAFKKLHKWRVSGIVEVAEGRDLPRDCPPAP